ncbi:MULTISPECIES: ATP-binding protein [Thermomonosporaceae]|uniref:ATP-binding protein n=1 Tax=Thermomonosporaceae TaxID=2012 RepID=UPI00255AA3A0|nr:MULTISPECIES: ATP-binding protein [Thermomonosporaceae]MDL4774980.1 ATP-binding protein [Actinomadura xylanilytica]
MSIRVASEAESIKKVRDLVSVAFRGMGCSEETVHLGATVATELATNAYRHAAVAGFGIVARTYDSEDGPVIEVWDASDQAPEVQAVDFVAESGRGLLLMEALVTCWGYTLLGTGGKVVWAAVRTDDGT